MTVAAQIKRNDFLFAAFPALHGLVHRRADRVVGLGRRHDTLCSGKRHTGLKGRKLIKRGGFNMAIV